MLCRIPLVVRVLSLEWLLYLDLEITLWSQSALDVVEFEPTHHHEQKDITHHSCHESYTNYLHV